MRAPPAASAVLLRTLICDSHSWQVAGVLVLVVDLHASVRARKPPAGFSRQQHGNHQD
jgi:hypothetical protein